MAGLSAWMAWVGGVSWGCDGSRDGAGDMRDTSEMALGLSLPPAPVQKCWGRWRDSMRYLHTIMNPPAYWDLKPRVS